MSINSNYDPIIIDGLHKLFISNLNSDIDYDVHILEEEMDLMNKTARSKKEYHSWLTKTYTGYRRKSSYGYDDGVANLNQRISTVIKNGLANKPVSQIKNGYDAENSAWDYVVVHSDAMLTMTSESLTPLNFKQFEENDISIAESYIDDILFNFKSDWTKYTQLTMVHMDELIMAREDFIYSANSLKAQLRKESRIGASYKKTSLIEKFGKQELEERNMSFDFTPFEQRIKEIKSKAIYYLSSNQKEFWESILEAIVQVDIYDQLTSEYLLLSKQQVIMEHLSKMQNPNHQTRISKEIDFFKLKSNDVALKNEIYTLLAINGFIDSTRDNRNQIVAFFTHSNTKGAKVIWKKNVADLNKFIKILELYSDVPTKRKWEITASFFCKKNGQDVTPGSIKSFGKAKYSDEIFVLERQLKALFK